MPGVAWFDFFGDRPAVADLPFCVAQRLGCSLLTGVGYHGWTLDYSQINLTANQLKVNRLGRHLGFTVWDPRLWSVMLILQNSANTISHYCTLGIGLYPRPYLF